MSDFLNTELYNKDSVDVDKVRNYFYTRREFVAQITILPNFCVDSDMTYFMRKVLLAANVDNSIVNDLQIYRGMVCELRQNYPMSITDLIWLYPQICKNRGYVELNDTIDTQKIKDKIKSIEEISIDKLIEAKQQDTSDTYALSPFYNSIGLYQTNSANQEWGTSTEKSLLGYDISCDKYLIHYLVDMLQIHDLTIQQMHSKFLTTKIGNTQQSIRDMVNDSAKAIVEYVTGVDENECGKWITDYHFNWIFRNDSTYFFFNHSVNLLALNPRPTVLMTAMVAGVQLYANDANNHHPFNYAFPVDTGMIYNTYHKYEDLNADQKKRINTCFTWDRDKIPFNTYLMQQVQSSNTSEWKAHENTLQVVPSDFYRVIYCRLSTHNVYDRLSAESLINLMPGEEDTLIHFPLEHTHVILKTLINNYHQLHTHTKIINEEFYDQTTKRLQIPKRFGRLILRYK